MRRLLLALVGLLSVVGGVSAADAAPRTVEPVAPVSDPFNWTGFYIGAEAGYGFGGAVTHQERFAVGTASSGEFDLSGGLVGATAGYNYQFNKIVLGAEADFAWSDIKGVTLELCAGPCSTEVRSFGTARARIGYAWDRFLPYVTGGVAFGNVEGGFDGPVLPPITGSDFRTGWTIGGGVEMALWQRWSAKVEYLYYDLGRFDYGAISGTLSTNANGNIVRVGLNYRF